MNKRTTKKGFEVVNELLLLFMMLLQYSQLMLVKGFQLEQLLLTLLLCLLQLCEMKDSVVKCLLPSLTIYAYKPGHSILSLFLSGLSPLESAARV